MQSVCVSSTTGPEIFTPVKNKRKDKERRAEGLEFDGTTVLCRVCGDKASGFHYGVHSCEGCKGFFRRSIQQKIQYRPCTKNQQCSILRINRNRCQYCRLKKCIAVGMSRDAVRFGRVPKREKAKILAAMQSVNARSQERALAAELEDEALLVATVIKAHEQTCDYTQEKVSPLLQRALEDPVYTQCPSQLACPLNPNPQPLQNGILEDFSERFSPAIRGVVEFAKRIPGFSLLSQDDQVTLLKAGVFEVLLVRLACMFNSQTNTMLCLNGQVLKRESLHSTSNARFLMDSMFDFAERLNQLRLRDSDLGLFCAVVIIAADRPGLRNTELVEKMQSKLMQALQTVVTQGRPDLPHLFQELMKKIPDLRTLNTLHSEKLLAFKMEPRHHPETAISALSVSALNNYMAAPSSSSSPGVSWGSLHNQMHHGSPGSNGEDSKGSWSERDLVMQSPGQRSNAGSEWSQAESKEAESSSEKSPLGSSKDSESVCSNEVALITDLQGREAGSLKRRRIGDGSEGGSSSGDEGSVSDGHNGSGCSPPGSILLGTLGGGRRCPFKLRKLESPCDSGIESGKEAGSTNGTQSAGTSLCGSPRSLSDEKVKDVEQETGTSIDDMPVLKRTLQAPPLINTNLLMEEAYKPHKKFRALRKEPDVQPSSPEMVMMTPTPTPSPPQHHRNHTHTPVSSGSMSVLAQQLTSGSSVAPSLASTHSMLVRSLEQGPKLTEQQMKHTDIIHNYIMGNSNDQTSGHDVNLTSGSGRMMYSIPQQQQQQQQCYQSNASSTSTTSGKAVVVCPPGYYIPHHQTPPSWPFASGAVRPAATFVPQQTVVHHHHHQGSSRLSPESPVLVVSASASPQPPGSGSPKLPRMYYDPRSTSPTSQSGSSSPAVAAAVVVPTTGGSFVNYGSVASKSAVISPALSAAVKPASPLAGQVLEIQHVTGSENQPLNLSKKVAALGGVNVNHKVKIEMLS